MSSSIFPFSTDAFPNVITAIHQSPGVAVLRATTIAWAMIRTMEAQLNPAQEHRPVWAVPYYDIYVAGTLVGTIVTIETPSSSAQSVTNSTVGEFQRDTNALSGLVVRPFYFAQPTTPWRVLSLIQEMLRICWERPATDGILVRASTGKLIQGDDTAWGGHVSVKIDPTRDVSNPVKWKLVAQALLKMVETATKDQRWESFTAAFLYNDMKFAKMLVDAPAPGVVVNQTVAS